MTKTSSPFPSQGIIVLLWHDDIGSFRTLGAQGEAGYLSQSSKVIFENVSLKFAEQVCQISSRELKVQRVEPFWLSQNDLVV